jgi:hypothetical protein
MCSIRGLSCVLTMKLHDKGLARAGAPPNGPPTSSERVLSPTGYIPARPTVRAQVCRLTSRWQVPQPVLAIAGELLAFPSDWLDRDP